MTVRICKLFGIMIFGFFSLTACGGGGESDDGPSAVFRFAEAVQDAQPVAGVLMTLHFPPGVSVEIDPATGDVAESVIQVSGSGNSLEAANYNQESNELTFLVVNLTETGFTPGDFLTVALDVAPGVLPAATDFSLTGVSVSDTDGNVIDDLQPVMTVTIQ